MDLFFHLGLAADLISRDRPSNKIDLAYLYYLPFCMVFVSNDNLHARTIPLFLRPDQVFLSGPELKEDLKRLDDHYSQLPEEVRTQGIMKFAHNPPLEGDYLVCRLWDRFLPRWRDNAARRMDMSNETEKEILERLKDLEEEARRDESARPVDVQTADQVMFERLVPIRRGKWRLVPPEAENRQTTEEPQR